VKARDATQAETCETAWLLYPLARKRGGAKKTRGGGGKGVEKNRWEIAEKCVRK